MEVKCPLTQKVCMKQECAWYAAGIDQCAIVAIGMITEKIHDMSSDAYKVYVAPPQYGDEEIPEEDGGQEY